MTVGLYIPEPLLNGYRTLIQTLVPAAIEVTIAQTELAERSVNLWPQTPNIESLALAGGMRARLRLQATSSDVDVNSARKTGDIVRYGLAGRGPRGALINRPQVDGFSVIDVVASEGRSDDSQGVGQWTEIFEILYDSRTPVIAES